MKRLFLLLAPIASSFLALAVACSSDPPVGPGGTGTSSGTTADSGEVPEEDSGEETSSSGGTQCSAARDQLLKPIAKKSTGEVKVVSEASGVTTLFVDASAGGTNVALSNPRIYLTLAGERVDITDKDAPTSTEWDLAMKRAVLFTNSGDLGPGKGGGVMVNKAFAAVTKADADAAKVASEKLFDEDCKPAQDENGDIATSFTGWYDYDQTTHIPTPKTNVTFIVKSAAGVRYKVAVESYQGTNTGGAGQSTANYLLKVQQL